MPIQAVDDRRLYRQIADQLTRLITSGEFRRGERLPSERDLAVQLGVSRPSVREALIALEIQGLVEVRVGAGIFVARSERPATVPINEGQGPFELLRARWLIEGEIAALAAREATKADLALVRTAVETMQQLANKNQETVAADRDFHLRVAAAAHNGELLSVVLYLCDGSSKTHRSSSGRSTATASSPCRKAKLSKRWATSRASWSGSRRSNSIGTGPTSSWVYAVLSPARSSSTSSTATTAPMKPTI